MADYVYFDYDYDYDYACCRRMLKERSRSFRMNKIEQGRSNSKSMRGAQLIQHTKKYCIRLY